MYDINDLPSLKRHWLLRTSNIPRRFIGLEPSDIVERTGEFSLEISTWVDDVLGSHVIKQVGKIGTNGVGLLLDGGPGIGKTTHAVVAAMEVIRRLPDDTEECRKLLGMSSSDFGMQSRPVHYITYPEFLSKKKSSFDADPEEKKQTMYEIDGMHGRSRLDHLNVRILVIDDLGKEYGSKYDESSFDEILRSRYDRGLPTIITTNVRLENWEEKYKQAMASFAHEAFVRVPIVGSDLRAAL